MAYPCYAFCRVTGVDDAELRAPASFGQKPAGDGSSKNRLGHHQALQSKCLGLVVSMGIINILPYLPCAVGMGVLRYGFHDHPCPVGGWLGGILGYFSSDSGVCQLFLPPR